MKPMTHDQLTRIAVPCYQGRVLPRFGIARDFFFADCDLKQKALQDHALVHIPEHRTRFIADWLYRENVAGVVCGGIHPRFQYDLQRKGIWLLWGARGEVLSVLEEFLQQELKPAAGSLLSIEASCPKFLTPCCRRQGHHGRKEKNPCE